jgi:hypothetical protein
MVVMLDPMRRTVKRLWQAVRAAVALAPVLAWGFGLWAATVAVPARVLSPGEGLDRPVAWSLCALPPLALALAALSGEATVVLAFGLLTLLPALVACPELQGPRMAGPSQALLVAALLIGFVAQAWRVDRPVGSPSLRQLWPRPCSLRSWLLAGFGGIGLALAWLPGEDGPDLQASARAARVAAVTLAWLAVRHVALARAGAPSRGRRALGQRLAWLVLFGAAWWLWRQPPA